MVIVDAGSGMTPWIQRWWRAAKQVFLITTEQEQAVKNSYAAVKLAPWGDADGKLRLVVNRCDQRESAEQLTARFSSTCRRFLGLHVEQAPAIACGQASRVAFGHSMRLLAADIVSSCLVVSSRLSNHQHTEQQQTEEMLAPPEKLAHSTNYP